MSSSDSSDFDMDMDDVNEGAQVRVQASVLQSARKIEIMSDDMPSEIEEENMDDWDDDSQALSIYKHPIVEEEKSKEESKTEKKLKFYHLFDKPKEKRTSKLDVEGRFYKYKAKVNEKIQSLAKVLEEKEVEECSFKPTILNKSKTRSVPEFLKNMKRFEEKRQEKIKIIKDEEEKVITQQTKKCNPRLCKNSLILASKNTEKLENTLERLSKAKLQSIPPADTNPYKPTVNLRSRELSRGKSIDKILYEDALRRASKTFVEETSVTEPFISHRSERVLLEKFKREYSDMFGYLDLEGSKTLNYTKFTTLLYNMNFIARSSSRISSQRQLAIKIWALLEGEKNAFVGFKNLQTMLVCIMNYRDPSIPVHSEEPALGKMIKGVFRVTQAEILKIHHHFFLLYSERNNFSTPVESSISEVTTSETRKKYDTKHEEMLILEKEKLQEKWESIRQQKLLAETSGCTFQPKIKRGPKTLSSCSDLNDSTASQYSLYSETLSQTQRRTDILHDYSKIFNQQRYNSSKNYQDSKSMGQVKSCTFKPKIAKRIMVDDVPEAKGVRQLISRLRNSRKQKASCGSEKPFVFDMENHTAKLSIDLNSSCYSSSSRNSALDKSYISDSDTVSIRICLPNGKKTFFRVGHAESKVAAINKFVEKNSLKGEAESKLRAYLKGI